MMRRSPPRSAADLIPPHVGLDELRARAAKCTACPLYANATQTVFGEGPATAEMMLVGETPGDQEALTARPLLGPPPRLLPRCLAAAAIHRPNLYPTNV